MFLSKPYRKLLKELQIREYIRDLSRIELFEDLERMHYVKKVAINKVLDGGYTTQVDAYSITTQGKAAIRQYYVSLVLSWITVATFIVTVVQLVLSQLQ